MIPRPHKANDSDLVHLDDESLVAEVRRGGQDGFTVLYERFSQSVFDIARRILGDNGEAEEVVQQVFLEVYQRISQFDAEKGSFKLWVLNTGRRRSIDRQRYLRARHVHEVTQLDEHTIPDSGPPGPMAPFSQQELEHFVKEMLNALPARERRVIKLHFVRGLTLEEVTREMKESLSVVRHLYYGGINKLRLGLSGERKSRPDHDKRKGQQ